MTEPTEKNPTTTKPIRVVSEMLTEPEIAALRQHAKESSAYYQKAFAHLRPKAK